MAVPHVARVYDYLLGGTDNSPADRAVGDQIIATLPEARDGVRAQRDVLIRVVRYLAGEAGVTQFLDIGSGLPTASNVHQVARRVNPAARVRYIDNDPLVVSRARQLLDGDPGTSIAEGDLRDPAAVIAEAREFLDWSQPVGLLLCGILHYIPDDEHPAELTRTLCETLPHGSYLFIHHLLHAEESAALEATLRRGLGNVQFRTKAQVHALFADLDLIDPGLVRVPDWRPDPDTPTVADHPALALACAALARKP